MSSKIGGHTGYLLIDNRASPGVSEEFIRASGKNAPFAPEGTCFEADTYTCSHCHAVVIKNPQRQRERAICRKCMRVVCDTCITECVPFNKVLEDLQNQAFHNVK